MAEHGEALSPFDSRPSAINARSLTAEDVHVSALVLLCLYARSDYWLWPTAQVVVSSAQCLESGIWQGRLVSQADR